MTEPDRVLQEECYYDQIIEIQVETEALRVEVWKDHPDFSRMSTAAGRISRAVALMEQAWSPPPVFVEEEAE